MDKTKIKNGLSWFFKSFIWLGLLLLVIDIVTKNVIVANKEYISSRPGGQGIVLIPNFLAINYVVNTGAAFGLTTGNLLANRIIYIVFAVLVCIAVIFFYIKKYQKLGKMYKATMMMILVGAIGNMIDRIFFTTGYLGEAFCPNGQPGVVDWINFFGVWAFNFNIADAAIVIGVILLAIWLIIEEIRDSKKAKKVEFANEAKVEETSKETVKEVKAEPENIIDDGKKVTKSIKGNKETKKTK